MKAATAKAVTVRIAPCRSVLIEGRRREAGELVTVTEQDADTLIGEGYALASDQTTPASHRRPDRTPRGRRTRRGPLTPRSILDGDEERGGDRPSDAAEDGASDGEA